MLAKRQRASRAGESLQRGSALQEGNDFTLDRLAGAAGARVLSQRTLESFGPGGLQCFQVNAEGSYAGGWESH